MISLIHLIQRNEYMNMKLIYTQKEIQATETNSQLTMENMERFINIIIMLFSKANQWE